MCVMEETNQRSTQTQEKGDLAEKMQREGQTEAGELGKPETQMS